jgi:hypothetical protein
VKLTLHERIELARGLVRLLADKVDQAYRHKDGSNAVAEAYLRDAGPLLKTILEVVDPTK